MIRDITQIQQSGNKADIIGGSPTFNATAGTDENGHVGVGNTIESNSRISIVRNTVVLTPRDISEEDVELSATTVMDAVTEKKYLDTISSLRLRKVDRYITAWDVTGSTQTKLRTITLNANTGELLSNE